MDENHQDKTESKLIATDDIRWGVNRKSKLWVPKHKKRTGFEGKTLWDKLNLFGTLAIPLIIALATIGFGLLQVHLADVQHQTDQRLAQQQHDNDQKIAIQQHNIDQQVALDQQQAAILQTYIDNIQDLLLNHHLLTSKSNDDVAILARARTLTALQGLDSERKARLVQFIYEARLIGFTDNVINGKIHDPIIDLSGANLSDANLVGTKLEGANLDNANLSSANFTVILGDPKPYPADLDKADLKGADLSGAELTGAYLHSAILERASLFSAHLFGADLGEADLKGADLSGDELKGAFNLTQQQLDQVYSCQGATLPPGLTCHRNP